MFTDILEEYYLHLQDKRGRSVYCIKCLEVLLLIWRLAFISSSNFFVKIVKCWDLKGLLLLSYFRVLWSVCECVQVFQNWHTQRTRSSIGNPIKMLRTKCWSRDETNSPLRLAELYGELQIALQIYCLPALHVITIFWNVTGSKRSAASILRVR
jgi:hypothetical protein